MKKSGLQRRIATTASIFLALFVVALIRTFHLCVVQSPELRAKATKQHARRVSAPTERGAIVDRHGELLAMTVGSASIYMRPHRFDVQSTGYVAKVMGMPAAEVSAAAAKSSKFVWLRRAVTPEQADALADVPGIGFEASRRRIYPRGTLAGQVIGLSDVDLRGHWGVEESQDRFLRGVAEPVSVECDARGRGMMREGAPPPLSQPGARVELTLDSTLQQVVETELETAVTSNKAEAGTAVVMDPNTGEILALANYPTFDPGARGGSLNQLARNRAISDFYEPGSTFKAIVAAAALEAGVVRPDEKLYCEGGSYTVGKRVVHDHESYGWLTFADVIKHSSNICTAKVGERLGPQRLGPAIAEFGFGRPTGLGLPGESRGLVRPWQNWARIHTVTTSFGQGISVTPIQLIRGFSVLANGGRLMRPYLVRRVTAADGTVLVDNQPVVEGRPISAETARTVTQMLLGVVEAGTGTKAQVEGISVAGKTGTAQKVVNGKYSARDRMSSFIGYLPAEAPRFVILVVIDTPRSATYGGLVAAPAFRKIAEFGVDRLGLREARPQIQPVEPAPQVQLAGWTVPDARPGMPSFLGLSMREALKEAQRAGWVVKTDGSGVVVEQDPPVGAVGADGRTLKLRLATAAG